MGGYIRCLMRTGSAHSQARWVLPRAKRGREAYPGLQTSGQRFSTKNDSYLLDPSPLSFLLHWHTCGLISGSGLRSACFLSATELLKLSPAFSVYNFLSKYQPRWLMEYPLTVTKSQVLILSLSLFGNTTSGKGLEVQPPANDPWVSMISVLGQLRRTDVAACPWRFVLGIQRRLCNVLNFCNLLISN